MIDREKAAIMPTEKALPLLDDKAIDWPKSGSQAGRELAAQIAPYVQAHIVEYTIAHDAAAFIQAVKDAIRERRIIRTAISTRWDFCLSRLIRDRSCSPESWPSASRPRRCAQWKEPARPERYGFYFPTPSDSAMMAGSFKSSAPLSHAAPSSAAFVFLAIAPL